MSDIFLQRYARVFSKNQLSQALISRSIEIDLKEILRETKIPEPMQPSDGMLM